MLDRTAERSGQLRTVPESHHEIRPTIADAEIGGKLPPHGGNLDRLIDEGMPELESRRLKGETLTASSGFCPVGGFVLVRDEHGNTGRASELALIIPVFSLLREHQIEDQTADPIRQDWIAGGFRKQAVSRRKGCAIAESNPRFQFFYERDIVHLRTVARDQIGEDLLTLLPLREKQHPHALTVSCGFQEPEMFGRDRAPIIDSARRLTMRNSVEQVCPFGRRSLQVDPNSALIGIVARNRPKSEGAGSLDHVLDGAAEAGEHMMIVGIDSGQATPGIGQHEDRAIREPKLPRLRVMAVCRQGGITDKLSLGR